ncbi:MAG TPA: RNA polymerase sporulation sigma factor SigK [Tissierellaceae bacterium]|nr:RNA polymerase sporulation sigma factor SigK [Tissierellaceae bacterium]
MKNTILYLLSIIFKPFIILCGYMMNTNSFPQPLDKEEEAKYLKLYEQGDKKAKDILIERNLRLVAHVVKKYHNTGKDIDDLISIGTIGLIKGINTYNPNKGARLSTYAARCIDNEILMSIRSNKKINLEQSLHDPIGSDKEGNEINLLDILGTDIDEILNEVDLKLQTRELYNQINEELDDREKSIIKSRYGLNNQATKTQREIADQLGISRSYVSRIENKVIKKLSKIINKQ